MIPPALRRTALAAALVALALPASADTDAGFAASLGKAPAGLATMAQLKAQSQQPAAAQVSGPTAPADAWKKILDLVKRDGVKGADKDFFSQSLEVFSGDPKLEYTLHRVTVFYFLDANRNLRIAGVEFALERRTQFWTIVDFGTDYWDILADSSGEAGQAIYKSSFHSPGNATTTDTPAVVDLADPRVKARFDEMIRFWSAR